MMAHSWPGNLRELRNAVERAVILAPHDTLDLPILGSRPTLPTSADGGRNAGSRRRADLTGIAGAGTHRADRRAVALSGSGGADPRDRRHDPAAETQAIRPRVEP